MRILHITRSPFFSTYGGLEIYLQQIVKWQLTNGHEVTILSIDFYGENWEICERKKDGLLHVLELHIPESYCTFDTSFFLPEMQTLLKEILNRIHPDIMHAHHGFAHEAVPICNRLVIPSIYTVHCGEPFCATGMKLLPNGTTCNGRGSLRKCLYCRTSNLRFGSLTRWLALSLPNFVRYYLERRIDSWPFIYFVTPVLTETRYLRNLKTEIEHYSLCKTVIAPSKAIAELATNNGLTAPISILPHALPDEITKFPYPRFNNNIVNLYYIGRICHYKGIHLLLEACKKLNTTNWRLHIIGDAERASEKTYKDKLMAQYDNVKIIWHGKVEHQHIFEMIKNYHLLVHPALCLESFGLTIAEALAMGKPVLSTACGGPEEQIIEGINGWIVPKNNVDALKDRIDYVLQHPEQLQEMSKNCKRIPYEAHINALMETYQKAINS